MKNNILFIFYSILCFIIGFIFANYYKDFDQEKPEIIPDTNLVKKWDKIINKDTILSPLQKIFIKKMVPKQIRTQNIDSNFIEKHNLNYILNIKKEKDSLRIFAINQNQLTAKEFVFKSNLPEFKITSMAEEIFYLEESRLLQYNSTLISARIMYDFNNKKFKIFPEIRSNFNLFDNIYFTININSIPEIGFSIGYKLF